MKQSEHLRARTDPSTRLDDERLSAGTDTAEHTSNSCDVQGMKKTATMML